MATVTAFALVAAGWALTHRSLDLPEPAQVVVTASDPGPHVLLDTSTGAVTGVEQSVTVAVSEAPDVGVRLLHLTGPGLRNNTLVETQVDRDVAGADIPVQAALDCPSNGLAAAVPADYGVVVRRTTRDGGTAVDQLPLGGGGALLDLVRAECFTQQASQQLEISEASVRAVTGSLALDLALTVVAHGPSTWSQLHVVGASTGVSMRASSTSPSESAVSSVFTAESPSPLVPLGGSTTVEPGHPGVVHARFWPQDCANPHVDGSLVVPVTAVEGTVPAATEPDGPVVELALPQPTLTALDRAVTAVCGTAVPSARVTSAVVRTGANDASAGTLDLTVAVAAPGADFVSIASSPTDAGLLEPTLGSLHVAEGQAVAHVAWVVPTCDVVASAGVVPVHLVTLRTGDPVTLQRSYVVGFETPTLDVALARLCPVSSGSPTPVR